MSTNRPSEKNSPEQTAPLSKLIKDFTTAIEKNPQNAAAYFNRGINYHEQGNYDQAEADYDKAIELDLTLKAQIEYLRAHKQRRGDDLPDVNQLSSFLTTSDLLHLSKASKASYRLFKPALALKQLLNLVVRYELDEKKIEAGIKAKVNPILREVDVLLTQDPTISLKRAHIIDRSGRNFYWSPLEASHWSGNWVLRDMIFKHAKSIPLKADQLSGEMRAAEQLCEWDQKAYDYDLILMRAKDGAFTVSKKTPALIKQYNEHGENKMFQWGEVNGEWLLTELDEDTKKVLQHLDFPKTSSDKVIITTSDKITTAMYDALKKGHTPTHFDLDEYIRVAVAFVKKYPVNEAVPREIWDECDADSYKICHAQKKFPAWLVAVWCSTIQFELFGPLPDVKSIIAASEVCRLKLYYGEDFFGDQLDVGENLPIYKGRQLPFVRGRRLPVGGVINHDLVAMVAVCKMITDELGKFKQLLLEESKSTLGFSG